MMKYVSIGLSVLVIFAGIVGSYVKLEAQAQTTEVIVKEFKEEVKEDTEKTKKRLREAEDINLRQEVMMHENLKIMERIQQKVYEE